MQRGIGIRGSVAQGRQQQRAHLIPGSRHLFSKNFADQCRSFLGVMLSHQHSQQLDAPLRSQYRIFPQALPKVACRRLEISFDLVTLSQQRQGVQPPPRCGHLNRLASRRVTGGSIAILRIARGSGGRGRNIASPAEFGFRGGLHRQKPEKTD